MPKIKTRKAVVKRFKQTKSGKFMRHQAGHRHILESKSPKRKRQMSNKVEVAKVDLPRLKRALGQ